MRLLIITQKYDINDSNLGVFIDWWNKLSEKVEKIYILALEKRSEPTKANMEVISMGKETSAGFFGKILGFYAGLFKTIGKIDAILVHMVPKYVILAAPIAFFYRKPIFMWYTGVAAQKQLKLSIIFCRKVFTAHGAAMRVNTPKRIITGHGINVGQFKIPTYAKASAGKQNSKFKINDKITILSVGRITPSKGHDLIIRVVADLIKCGYDLRLKIIGGVIQEFHKKYQESLAQLAEELELKDKIEFIGAVSYGKMPEYFAGAEVIINAVPFGGLDKVVLEAMASGVIPLTSNSAFSDVFSPDIAHGLIFKIGDVENLKNKLKNILDKKLYQNDELRDTLRNIVVKSHNLDNLISRIIKEMV